MGLITKVLKKIFDIRGSVKYFTKRPTRIIDTDQIVSIRECPKVESSLLSLELCMKTVSYYIHHYIRNFIADNDILGNVERVGI